MYWCLLLLAQATADACNDPLDHMQGAGALITCVIHLSVLPCFTKWISDVNCFAVMIISLNLAGLDGCQPLVGCPSPPLNPSW